MRGCIVALVAGFLLGSCSDIRLEYPDEEEFYDAVDDELSLSGRFCTSEAGNVEYPVKVMFIVDGSGSQQFSDQNRQRVVAVEETINALIGLGTTYFKVVVFNASITATPTIALNCSSPVFTNDPGVLSVALNNLAEADSLTDYQGALSVAYDQLQTDIGCVFQDSPAELARTKYVVIFVSDGMPDPQCTIGLGNDFDPVNPTEPYALCENSDFINCVLKRDWGQPNGTECNFGTCANGAPGCTYNGNQAAACCFQEGVDPSDPSSPPNLFGGVLGESDLQGGNDYNQAYQILQKVEEIMELQDRYQIGELRIHSGLVLDPLADPTIIEIFGDAAQAAPLMEQVADLGNGQYMEFYGGDSIDFLQINFDSIKQQRVVRGFFADNRTLRMTVDGLEVDSDFDGLTDAEEGELGTDPRYRDSDGDGYSDKVELFMLGFSYDPRDPCFPPIDDVNLQFRTRTTTCVPADVWDPVTGGGSLFPCGSYGSGDCHPDAGTCTTWGYADTDRDGLHDCEERAIGTDPLHPDTDRDGMLDMQEFLYGLDPERWDFDRDDDKDAIPNGRELEWHLNPIIQQDDEDARVRYRYKRPEVGTTVDGRSCYEFAVRRLKLGYAQTNLDLSAPVGWVADPIYGVGSNEIRLYILENMADNLSGAPLVRSACVRTEYVPPSRKVPAAGEVVLDECDFWYLGNNEDAIFQNDPPDPDTVCGRTSVVQFNPLQHCITIQQ